MSEKEPFGPDPSEEPEKVEQGSIQQPDQEPQLPLLERYKPAVKIAGFYLAPGMIVARIRNHEMKAAQVVGTKKVPDSYETVERNKATEVTLQYPDGTTEEYMINYRPNIRQGSEYGTMTPSYMLYGHTSIYYPPQFDRAMLLETNEADLPYEVGSYGMIDQKYYGYIAMILPEAQQLVVIDKGTTGEYPPKYYGNKEDIYVVAPERFTVRRRDR